MPTMTSLSINPLTPVVVGVSSVIDRIGGNTSNTTLPDDVILKEPLDLMVEAIAAAIADASAAKAGSIEREIGFVATVPAWAWSYEDLPRQVSKRARLGRYSITISSTADDNDNDNDNDDDRHTAFPHGGNYPVAGLDRACRRIAAGKINGAVIVGGDALASLAYWKKMKSQIPNTEKETETGTGTGSDRGPPGWTPIPAGMAPLDLKLIQRALEQAGVADTDDDNKHEDNTAVHKDGGMSTVEEERIMGAILAPSLTEASDAARSQVSAGMRHAAGMPVHVYALAEMRRRVRMGDHGKIQTLDRCQAESRALYSRFERIARAQPDTAWLLPPDRRRQEVQGGRRVSEGSGSGSGSGPEHDPWGRPVCLPYHMLECAHNTVNLGSAVIVVSAGTAARLGIPTSKWVFPLSGHGADDEDEFWLRPDIGTSRPIQAVVRTILHNLSEIRLPFPASPSSAAPAPAAAPAAFLAPFQPSSATINPRLIDIYSCFPIVPKLAAEALGLDPAGTDICPLTTLGGLTFFGGAGNNYSMHALFRVVTQLRHPETPAGGGAETADPDGDTALVLANGGLITHIHAVALSSRPSRFSFRFESTVSGSRDTMAMGPFVREHEPGLVPENAATPPFIELVSDLSDRYPASSTITLAPTTNHHTRWIRCVVESYTVTYDHAGTAVSAIILGRLIPASVVSSLSFCRSRPLIRFPPPSFPRFLANAANMDTITEMVRREDGYSFGVDTGPVIGTVGWCVTTTTSPSLHSTRSAPTRVGPVRNVFAFGPEMGIEPGALMIGKLQAGKASTKL